SSRSVAHPSSSVSTTEPPTTMSGRSTYSMPPNLTGSLRHEHVTSVRSRVVPPECSVTPGWHHGLHEHHALSLDLRTAPRRAPGRGPAARGRTRGVDAGPLRGPHVRHRRGGH